MTDSPRTRHSPTGEPGYTLEEIQTARLGLVELRDAALTAGDMHWAVVLSHTVAMLAELYWQVAGEDSPPLVARETS